MAYRVVSRFLHRASGAYIDPGQECPPLPVEDLKRLIRARCLVEVQDDPPSSGNGSPAGRKAREKRAEGAAPQEASPPKKE